LYNFAVAVDRAPFVYKVASMLALGVRGLFLASRAALLAAAVLKALFKSGGYLPITNSWSMPILVLTSTSASSTAILK
jgi:hypothetical protein